ncbi:MAG: AMIN domain-containing protein, partial [Candidatus Sericytochromatia bacterium]
MIKRALSCLLAASLWTLAPAQALAATPVAVEFQPTRQAVVLQLPAGVVPTTLELSNPPRFVIDLPGTYPVRPQSLAYDSG